jgi:hypothetical protein
MGTGVTNPGNDNRYKIGTITVTGGTAPAPTPTPTPTPNPTPAPTPTPAPVAGGQCYARTETSEPAGSVIYSGSGVIVPSDFGCWHDTGYVGYSSEYHSDDPNFKVFGNTVRVYGMNGLSWADTESNGWANWDKALAKMKATGVKQVVYVPHTPPGRLGNEHTSWGMHNVPYNDIASWLTQVKNKVYSYNMTLVVEVANEVFTPGVGAGSFWGGTVADLTTFSNSVLDWRKNTAPEVKIWSPSVPGFGANIDTLLAWLQAFPRRDEFSAIPVHWYFQDASTIASYNDYIRMRNGLASMGLNKPIVDGEHGFGGGAVTPGTTYNYAVRAATLGMSNVCYFFLGSPGDGRLGDTNLGQPWVNAWAKADLEDAARLAGRKITKVVKPNNSSDGRYWVQTDGQCYAGSVTTPAPSPTPAPIPAPTPAPTPAPAPTSSSKFSVGDRVKTTDVVNVRNSANGSVLGTQALGALGTVVSGGTNAGGYNWWNVNYDSGVDGWSAEDFLIKSTVTTPTPSPSPTGATKVNMANPSAVSGTAGSMITVLTNWVRTNMGGSFNQFMHLDNGGSFWSVDDHSVDTTSWNTGTVTDQRSITIPADMPSGTYSILTGLSGGTPWARQSLQMGTGVTNPGNDNRYKIGTITVTGGTAPAPTPTPTPTPNPTPAPTPNPAPAPTGTAGPRVSSFTNSGPITASAGQVISGVRIQNSGGPCIVIPSGASNVVVRDSDIGPCGGEANILVSGNSANIEYNSIHDGNRGILADSVSGVNATKNRLDTFYGSHPQGPAIEFDNMGSGNIVGNSVTSKGSSHSDAISVYASSNINVTDNYVNVNIDEPSSAPLMTGDAAEGKPPGRNIYVARNEIYSTGIGVPFGMLGCSGNCVVENNKFDSGIQAYNYVERAQGGIGSHPEYFVGITIRNNQISNRAVWTPGGTSMISGWNTNTFY